MSAGSRLSRQVKWCLAVLCLAPALAVCPSPARAASASASASVEIVPGIQVSRVADLSFGQVEAGVTAGSVLLTPDGARQAAGGASLAGDGASPAAFTVAGAKGAAYSLSLPTRILLSNGAASMEVVGFTTSAGAGRLGDAGLQTVLVGATLVVGERQPLGLYQGSFALTVAYD